MKERLKEISNVSLPIFVIIGTLTILYSLYSLIIDTSKYINNLYFTFIIALSLLMFVSLYFSKNDWSILGGIVLFLLIVSLILGFLSLKNIKLTSEELNNQVLSYYEKDTTNIAVYHQEKLLYDSNFIVFNTSLKDINEDDSDFNKYKNFCYDVLDNRGYFICKVQLKEGSDEEVFPINAIGISNDKYYLK